ncbi:RmlC-like cupin [Atractiella rhizophila]|nr:RmlC-like cupin [Atractiella rhizophila]
MAPTAVDRENMIDKAGESYIFDFLGSPLTGGTGKDGFFTLASAGNFPAAIGTGMSAAFFALGPCSTISPHHHPRATEFLYLIAGGPMRFGINFEAGGPYSDGNAVRYEYVQPGQAIMLPQGSMHYGAVLGCDPTVVVSMFNSEDPGFQLENTALFSFDDEQIKAALGIVGALPVDVANFPAPLQLGFESCLEACQIPPEYDISTVTKLQVMEAAISALSGRAQAGSLNTLDTTDYKNGPSDFKPGVPLQVRPVPYAPPFSTDPFANANNRPPNWKPPATVQALNSSSSNP